MTLTVYNIDTYSAGGQTTPFYQTAVVVGASVTAIIAVVTIYDSSSSDGAITNVERDNGPGWDSFTKIKEYYDAVCDGHVSIWLLNSPVTGLQYCHVTMGGTCTDITVSYIEIEGGTLEIDVVATEQTGNGSPSISWTNSEADAILIEASVSDQASDNFTLGAGQTQIHKVDFGQDFGLASYKIVTASESQTMYWDDSDDDEDWVQVGASFKEASSGYTLPIAVGSYAITGVNPSFKRTYKLVFAVGSYAITGTVIDFFRGYAIPIAIGSYAISGTTINFLRGYVIPVSVGSYVITGTDIDFIYDVGYILTIDVGSYAVSGNAIGLYQGYGFLIDVGSYGITGTSIEFLRSYACSISVGSYGITGISIDFLRTYNFPIAVGSYVITGTAINFFRGYAVSIAVGSYLITGVPIEFYRGYSFPIDVGSYVISGTDITLSRNYKFLLDVGDYIITGIPINLRESAITMLFNVGTYTINFIEHALVIVTTPQPILDTGIIQEIFLYDKSGNLLARISDYDMLTWNLAVNSIGTLGLVLDGYHPAVDLFEDNFFIDIWRKDGTADWFRVWQGLCKGKKWENKSDIDQITVLGSTHNTVLGQRIIDAYRGDDRAFKTMVSETAILEFVRENIGDLASVLSGRLHEGKVSNFIVPASLGRGVSWSNDVAGRVLLQIIQMIAEPDSIYFDVESNLGADWEFIINQYCLNTMRNADGLNSATGLNIYGYRPVYFSLENASMINPKYTRDIRKWKNVAICFGEGVEDERVTQETIGQVVANPYERAETAVNAIGDRENLDMTTSANQAIELYKPREEFRFEIAQTGGLRYTREYFFGDNVVAQYRGINSNCIIGFINCSINKNGENLRIRAITA